MPVSLLYQRSATPVWDANFNIHTGTIDEMRNQGMLSNIQNNSLKKSISTYYSFLRERIREDWNRDLIADWRKFLRDNYQIILTGEIPMEDLIEFVKHDKSVSTRIKELKVPRNIVHNLNWAINLAEETRQLIKDELGETHE